VPIVPKINSQSTKCALQLLLQTCGYYDSRLFSDQVLDRCYDVVFGTQSRRIQSADKLLQALNEFAQEESSGFAEDARQLRCFTQCDLTLAKAADVFLHIFRRYLCLMAQRPQSCFLVQELFRHCGSPGKTQVVQEVLNGVEKLVVHEKGNYLVTQVLEFLASMDGNFEHLLVRNYYWREFSQHFTQDLCQFTRLAKDNFASFVLKRYMALNNRSTNQMLLRRLEECGVKTHLANHEYGRFVIQHLKRYAGNRATSQDVCGFCPS
jgi:hypothetical protein